MGLVGAVLVTRWAYGLIKVSAYILLDRQAPEPLQLRLREAIAAGGPAEILDLHVWSIGPGIYSAAISLKAHPQATVNLIRERISHLDEIVHTTIEVHA
jgi:Co/Zn/Cd efflux system component